MNMGYSFAMRNTGVMLTVRVDDVVEVIGAAWEAERCSGE